MKNLLTILFLASSVSLFCQDTLNDNSETRWSMFKYDFGNIIKGVGYSYSRPLHWKGKQWKTFGGVVAGTGALYLLDDDSSRFISNQRESVPQFIRDYGEFYGNPENNYMVTSGVYLTGLITKNEKLRRTGVLLISSATAAGLLQQILKSSVGRARPVSGKTKDTFMPFSDSRNFHSFPSGHTIMAFTNAYAIAKQFKSLWVKSGIYLVGLIPGVSRVWDRQHWVTDFAIGIAISIFTVESIDRYLDAKYDKKYNDGSKNLSWNLNFGPGQMGLAIHF